jgi:acyl transferase domain-containing protein/acyl carrier protein
VNTNELKSWLIRRVAESVDLLPADIDSTLSFSSFGLDSVRLSTLAAELETVTGRRIHPSELFEHHTIDLFVEHLCRVEAPPTIVGGGYEPVAIVGMACRLPGAEDLSHYWQLLTEGRNAVSEVPPERWDDREFYSSRPKASGCIVSKWGGFLKDVAQFDNKFFHISAEEAVRMDPQQRLLLELCWEALEDSGEIPARLRGTMVGVFVGISGSEYAHRQREDREGIGPYMLSGNALAIAANRLSYVFDFRGPSMAIDTACSSSLVAVHLACNALAGGECDRAVAAGVNLLLDPEISIGLSQAGMLAPDGQCKAFDAKANGYVRGEGVGVVVLKPLSAAQATGDRIYAVIRGSAINQDGNTNGLTAPNPAAQREMLRLAYARAAVRPHEVDYVECHGTGTFLGDPIEAGSLGAVLGKGRDTRHPCYIGSVKSNIGHLEAAAGIAALLKTALALHHGVLPSTLHFAEPNPHIAFGELGLRVADHAMDWPAQGTVRRAGVNSFGFGGSNAHVVLESAKVGESASVPTDGLMVPLSAVSRRSLQRLIHKWSARLEKAADEEIPRLAQAACLRRTHHRPFRIGVMAESAAALRRRIVEVEEGFDRVLDGTRALPTGAPRIGFVFSGQGAQFSGMGRGLFESNSLFRSLIRTYDGVGRQEFGWSLEAALRGDPALCLDDSAIAQPVLLAIQLALVKLWTTLGIEPSAVVGHSLGEIGAAVTAGILDVPSAFRLASRRGQLMNHTARVGRMLATALDRNAAQALAERFSGTISLAAVNSQSSCVLAGERAVLEQIAEELGARQVPAQWLPVHYAFHSRAMDPVRSALAEEFIDLVPQPTSLPIYSTVLGKKAEFTVFTGDYWARGVRDPVEFAAAVEDLLSDGVDALLEIGPQVVLRGPLHSLTNSVNPRPLVLGSMEREKNERSALLTSLGALYHLGCSIQWSPLFPDGGQMESLPSYCWDHERFWIERKKPSRSAPAHVLLGAETEADAVQQRYQWENVLHIEQAFYLKDHRVHGQTVFPATGFIEMARAAAWQAGLRGPVQIRQLTVHSQLHLTEAKSRVRTELVRSGDAGSPRFTVSISSASEAGGAAWTLHVTGEVQPADAAALAVAGSGDMENARLVPPEAFYSMMARQGFDYGANYRKLATLWQGVGEATGDLVTDRVPSVAERVCLMDSALQLIAAAASADVCRSMNGLVPYTVESVVFTPGTEAPARAHARIAAVETGTITGDVTIFDENAHVCMQVRGLQLRASRAAEGRRAEPAAGDGLTLYEAVWRERAGVPVTQTERSRSWLILADRLGYSDALAGELRKKGEAAILCWSADSFRSLSSERLQMDPRRPQDYARMLEKVLADWPSLIGIVHLWALEGSAARDTGGEPNSIACESVLHLLKALSFSSSGAGVRLLVATRGCQAVPSNGTMVVTDPTSATIWGLLKTVPMENPLLPLVCVDLDPLSETAVGDLLNEMFCESGELEVAYRANRRYVRRITPSPNVPAAACVMPLRADSCYVITGGTGALGLHVAQYLAQKGVQHLILLGRHADRAAEHPALQKLRGANVEISVHAVDVADGPMLEQTLSAIRSRGRPIRGVVHAAGTSENGSLLEMTAESLQRVAASKVRGTWNVHRTTLQDPLDWFVLFSSAAGVLGSPGQANYASANAFLDAFAHYRHSLSLPALSIDWGPWGDGMAAGMAESGEAHRLRTGASVVEPEQGLALFGRLLPSKKAQVVVLPFDLANLLQFYPATTGMSFFEELATLEVKMLKSTGTQQSARPDLSAKYVPPRNPIEQRIAAIWQRSLAIERVGVLDSFFELGGDSVFANQMIVEVNRSLGISIEPERAFEQLTVAHLAELSQEQALEALQDMTDAEAERLLDASLTPMARNAMEERSAT